MHLPQPITQAYGRTTLYAKKNSPHILFGVGVASMVTSTVLACRATLKLEKELDNMRMDFESVRQNKEAIEATGGAYSRHDYFKDLTGQYAKTSLKVAKLYAPSIVVGGIGIACLTSSHIQMVHRNAALSGSLAMVTQAFSDYRDRVREFVGEEKELDLYRCMEDNEIEIDGKKVLAKVKNPDAPPGHSPFAVKFDERSTRWRPNLEVNRGIIQIVENTANQKLTAYGHVFLNEVYEDLGLPKTQAGQVFGWVRFGKNGESKEPIDFGAYDAINHPESRQPYDKAIWLDFNVDGDILYILDNKPPIT